MNNFALKVAVTLVFFLAGSFAGFAQDSQTSYDNGIISDTLDEIEASFKKALEEAEDAVGNNSESENEPEEVQREKIMLDALELSGMEIMDVLKLISKKSGLNIVAGKNVTGKVTIFLKNVDVWDVLNIILSANNLAYEEQDGIIQVMTDRDYELLHGKKFSDRTESRTVGLQYAQAADVLPILNEMKSIIGKVMADEKSNTLVLIDAPDKIRDMHALLYKIDVPVVTKIFELNYSEAEEFEKQIAEALTPNLGTVKIDTRTNKVVIKDTPEKIKEVEAIMFAFDERHKEVLIDAKIIKVILSDQFKMGVDWQYLFSQYHGLTFQGNYDILGAAEKFGKISVGTLEDDDYTAFLEILNTAGETNTLSSPRITALNNEEAKILVGSTEPYVTTTTTTTATGPSTTAETVEFIEVGVKLYVTPTINQDGFVTMKIKPEVSAVSSYVTTSQNNQIPIVETSEAETSVMVKDGATIVIGGLIKDEKIKTVKKVPLLGDIPFLGSMFRNTDELIRKTELVIFLTPHIITGEALQIPK
ncbi:secretin N-terminal domain-containing protein, partial [Candidatus Omnitrophota bacterium]